MATYTYDPAVVTSDLARVRLAIGDTDVADAGARAVFSDEEIAAFIAANRTWKGGAADALDAIAATIARKMRDIQSQDLRTEGSKTAAELRAQAKQLRAQDAEESAYAVQVW